MRLAVAIGVIAVTLASAVFVHERKADVYVTDPAESAHCLDATTGETVTNPEDLGYYAGGAIVTKLYCELPFGKNDQYRWVAATSSHRVPSGQRVRPSWEDPAAILLALGGVAVAVGIIKR